MSECISCGCDCGHGNHEADRDSEERWAEHYFKKMQAARAEAFEEAAKIAEDCMATDIAEEIRLRAGEGK